MSRARPAKREIVAQAQLVEQRGAQVGRRERADLLEPRLVVDHPFQSPAVDPVRLEPAIERGTVEQAVAGAQARERLAPRRRGDRVAAAPGLAPGQKPEQRPVAHGRIGVSLEAQLLEHALIGDPRRDVGGVGRLRRLRSRRGVVPDLGPLERVVGPHRLRIARQKLAHGSDHGERIRSLLVDPTLRQPAAQRRDLAGGHRSSGAANQALERPVVVEQLLGQADQAVSGRCRDHPGKLGLGEGAADVDHGVGQGAIAGLGRPWMTATSSSSSSSPSR